VSKQPEVTLKCSVCRLPMREIYEYVRVLLEPVQTANTARNTYSNYTRRWACSKECARKGLYGE
jgi:hypothetical protein